VQSSWSFVSRLREEGDSEFARNVMVDGDTIALTSGKKMVHVYTRAKFGDRDSPWVLSTRLELPRANDGNVDGDASGIHSSFGYSAALSGDAILIGSHSAPVTGGYGAGAHSCLPETIRKTRIPLGPSSTSSRGRSRTRS